MNIGEFELSMYCNEQIIAINQDPLFSPARPIMMLEDGATGKRIHVFKKRLSGGDLAICALNLGKTKEQFKISLDGEGRLTDAWAKRDMGISSSISLDMMPHTVRIFRVTGT